MVYKLTKQVILIRGKDENGCEIARFTNMAAILISIVSNNYYGMLRGQIHILQFAPWASHNVFRNSRNQNGRRVSVKRSKYKNQIHSSKATLLFFTFELQIWVILVLVAVARSLAYM